MTNCLSARQLAILRWVHTYQRKEHWAPNVRELSAAFDISVSTTHYHLMRLEQARVIEYKDGRRQMRVSEKGRRIL